MLADGAVPLLTSALPSLIVTYHCPPLSPLRLNWMVAFMFFAAFASSWPGIASKISWGVILKLLLSMGWWGLTGLRRLGEQSLSRRDGLHVTVLLAQLRDLLAPQGLNLIGAAEVARYDAIVPPRHAV